MTVQKLRQIFRSCADDTRLRIINLLSDEVLTAGEISFLLDKSKFFINRHLSALAAFDLVVAGRIGDMAFYTLNRKNDAVSVKVTEFIVVQFCDIQLFLDDKRRLREIKQ